jgi:deoxyadenosine/deoxycytidine kinase
MGAGDAVPMKASGSKEKLPQVPEDHTVRYYVKQYVRAPALFRPVTQDASGPKRRICSIKGLIGSGKTTLVRALAKRNTERGRPSIAITEEFNELHLGLFYEEEQKKAARKSADPNAPDEPNPYAFSFQIDMLSRCLIDYQRARYMTGRGPANQQAKTSRNSLPLYLADIVWGLAVMFALLRFSIGPFLSLAAAFVTRVAVHKWVGWLSSFDVFSNAADGGYDVFIDGNLSTNVVFAAKHAASGNIRPSEWRTYLKGALAMGPCELDGVLHLQVSPAVAKQRKDKRNRPGEEGIPLSYFEELDNGYAWNAHEQLMAGQSREFWIDNTGQPDLDAILDLLETGPSAQDISRKYQLNLLQDLEGISLEAAENILKAGQAEERIDAALGAAHIEPDGKFIAGMLAR